MLTIRIKLIAGRIAFWLGWPLWLLLLRGSERTRVLILADDRVLLVRGTLSAGEWGLPGGGIHPGEAVVMGACREVYEEIGIVLLPETVRELGVESARNSGIPYRAHYYTATLEDCRAAMLGFEIAEARWIPLAEVATVRHDAAVGRALELLSA